MKRIPLNSCVPKRTSPDSVWRNFQLSFFSNRRVLFLEVHPTCCQKLLAGLVEGTHLQLKLTNASPERTTWQSQCFTLPVKVVCLFLSWDSFSSLRDCLYFCLLAKESRKMSNGKPRHQYQGSAILNSCFFDVFLSPGSSVWSFSTCEGYSQCLEDSFLSR